jgi:hypothetical protein
MMQSLSLTSKVKARPHVGRAFAFAALFAAMCGGASAQTPTYAEIYVVPIGTTPAPKGTCTTKGSYDICVYPEPINTGGAVGTDVTITWDLKSAGWSFVKNKGIDIKNMKNWKLKEVTPTQYEATNKKENGVFYKYEINVTDGTITLPPWDPTIMN